MALLDQQRFGSHQKNHSMMSVAACRSISSEKLNCTEATALHKEKLVADKRANGAYLALVVVAVAEQSGGGKTTSIDKFGKVDRDHWNVMQDSRQCFDLFMAVEPDATLRAVLGQHRCCSAPSARGKEYRRGQVSVVDVGSTSGPAVVISPFRG